MTKLLKLPKVQDLMHEDPSKRLTAKEEYKSAFRQLRSIRESMKQSGHPEDLSLDDFLRAQNEGIAALLLDMEAEDAEFITDLEGGPVTSNANGNANGLGTGMANTAHFGAFGTSAESQVLSQVQGSDGARP